MTAKIPALWCICLVYNPLPLSVDPVNMTEYCSCDQITNRGLLVKQTNIIFGACVCDSLQPHGLWPTRRLCPRESPGKNTGVGCHALFHGIFPTQGSNCVSWVSCFSKCTTPWFQPAKALTSSVQFSHSVLSDSLQSHGLQHTKLPCPSPTPGVYSDPYPWSQWCHPTISSSVIPFSSRLPSFPASGSFQMSQFFKWGGQSTEVSASASVLPMYVREVSASASVLPMYVQDWFPLGWTGWISLQSQGLSTVFSTTTVQRHQFCSSIKTLTRGPSKLRQDSFFISRF